MERNRYDRVKEVFLEIESLPDSRRTARLNDLCGDDDTLRAEIERLLAAHESDEGVLSTRDTPNAAAGVGPATGEVSIPERIGKYTIDGLLGQGGMGVVYRARQANPDRTVALKLIRPGLGSPRLLRRFEVEAQVLGRLQHTGIAQIFEAGTADTGFGEQPFFAMELIEGQPLSEYARTKHLSTDDKLRLICAIGDAVQHAHIKGVIHRDLKPGNILVTADGQPKILDFGVARLTDADTQVTTLQTGAGQLIGTLPYMSPEQVAGTSADLDTRSDVYALGVILYELLADRLPHPIENASLPQALRIVSSDEPQRLSALTRRLKGDIETIVHKAIERDKSRRYQSAAEFVADIRRYLADEPITARPATTAYQFRKLVARHKLPFALILGLFVVIAGFGVWMSFLYAEADTARIRALRAETLKAEEAQRANEAAERARREAALAQRVQTFLIDIFESNNPDEAQGQDITAREILDRGAERIAQELDQEPLVRATMMEVIAKVCLNLSYFDRARTLAEQSLDIRERELGRDDLQVAASLETLAAVIKYESDYDKALEMITEAIAISRAHLPEEHVDLARRLVFLGELYRRVGNLDESDQALLTALEMQRKLLGDDDPEIGETLNQLVYLRRSQDRLDEGLVYAEQCVENQKRAFGEHDTKTAAAQVALGDMLFRLKRLDEAEQVIRAGLQTLRDRLEPDHPYIGATLNNLGMVLKAKREFDQAQIVMEESLALRRDRFGPDHPDVSQGLFNLASLFLQQDKNAEAEPLLADALRILDAHFDADHPDVLLVRYQHGLALLKLEQFDRAEAALRKVLEGYERTLPEGHRFTAYTQGLLGSALTGLERYEEAEPLLLASREVLKDHDSRAVSSARRLRELYTAWNKPDLAARFESADSTP